MQIQTHRLMEGINAVEMVSGAMMYIKISSGIQKLIGGEGIHSHTGRMLLL
jgi:hypothetical protein